MINFSKVIAGCMNWGVWGKNLITLQMRGLIESCFEEGITSFDHADIYGGYTTEEAFGKALKNCAIKREQIQLITKCGIQYLTENSTNKVKHYDYSKDYIIQSAEASLKHLNTDYIDLFLLHRPSPLMNPYEIATAIDSLKRQGKIKAFGVSNFSVSQMQLLHNYVSIECNQIEFSINVHQAMHNGVLDYMYSNKILPMAWSPLGNFFNTDNPQNSRIEHALHSLCQKYQAQSDQLLLAWIQKHPSGIIPVVGTTQISRLQRAMKSSQIELELEDWFLLLVAAQGHKVP